MIFKPLILLLSFLTPSLFAGTQEQILASLRAETLAWAPVGKVVDELYARFSSGDLEIAAAPYLTATDSGVATKRTAEILVRARKRDLGVISLLGFIPLSADAPQFGPELVKRASVHLGMELITDRNSPLRKLSLPERSRLVESISRNATWFELPPETVARGILNLGTPRELEGVLSELRNLKFEAESLAVSHRKSSLEIAWTAVEEKLHGPLTLLKFFRDGNAVAGKRILQILTGWTSPESLPTFVSLAPAEKKDLLFRLLELSPETIEYRTTRPELTLTVVAVALTNLGSPELLFGWLDEYVARDRREGSAIYTGEPTDLVVARKALLLRPPSPLACKLRLSAPLNWITGALPLEIAFGPEG